MNRGRRIHEIDVAAVIFDTKCFFPQLKELCALKAC